MAAPDVKRMWRRLQALKQERRSWEAHWRELAEYMLPKRSRFLDGGDRPNDGAKLNSRIIDGTALRAIKVLSAGMQGGLTSPARPWFRLGTSNRDLMQRGRVRQWLHEAREIMLEALARSNFYDAVHSLYEELAVFGTAAMLVEEDDPGGIRCRTLTCGEYYAAPDPQGRINTLYRAFQMTAGQIADHRGWTAPQTVLDMAGDPGRRDTWLNVVHAVEPEPGRPGCRSVYFLDGHDNAQLSAAGYAEFPALCPRWDVLSGDVYGRGPGMDALGDCKMLQEMQRTVIKALQKKTDPPLQAPARFKNEKLTQIPGGVNLVDQPGAGSIAPLYAVDLSIRDAEFKIERVQQAVRDTFYNDLFLMLAGERRSMTATEVTERHEEKLLMLGPVLERLHCELHAPLIHRVFGILARQGLLPAPPAEAQGANLKIEFIGLLSQAQKLIGISAIQHVAGFVAQMAQAQAALGTAEVFDKFDPDEAVDQFAEAVGVPPSIVRADEDVDGIRQERRKAADMAARMAGMQQAIAGAKMLSETKTDKNNALGAVLRTLPKGGFPA